MSIKKTTKLTTALYEYADQLGFAKVGICGPDSIKQAPAKLFEFINKGYHGQMYWMQKRMQKRSQPQALWSQVRSIVVLADSYTPNHNPMEILSHHDRGAISIYAQNRDYHDLIKKRLKKLGRWLIARHPDAAIKIFVDTAPVMEKPLAQAAGLGWIGKHSNLLGRDLGNWFFLGVIFTTIDLPTTIAESDHCGSCRACLDICPTDAFPKPYQLDARRCISYLTIEHKGAVPYELRGKLGNRIYGCDDCLAICPWNKFARQAHEIGYHARSELKSPKLADLIILDDAAFRRLFTKSPIKRIGRNRFIRNVLYAIGNSGQANLYPYACKLTNDTDATVADAAVWAKEKLEKSCTIL